MLDENGKEVAAPESQADRSTGDIVNQALGDDLYSNPEQEEAENESTEETTKEETTEEAEDSATEATEEPGETTEEETTEEEDPENAEAVKDLSDEQKDRIQKRMGQLTSIRKEAEGKLAAAEAQLESKAADITDLEARLESARKGGQSLPMEAALLQVSSGKELDAELDKLEAMIDWCEDHLDDGFEPDEGDSIPASDIRKRLRALQKFEKRVVPRAKGVLVERETASADARKAYPDLFDKNTESGQRYRRMLLDHPELKAIPSLPMLVGDALAGEALRAAPPKKQPKKAPDAPAASAAPEKKEITDPSKKQKKQTDLGKVIESGGSRDSLAGAIMDLNIV